MSRIVEWSYKWLPIIMGCHCRPDRTFFIKGKPMPVCARCEGVILGVIAAFIAAPFGRLRPVFLLLMLLPLIADGIIQACTKYESNNWRRLFTGILFGYAATTLIIISLVATFKFGYEKGAGLSS